MTAQLAEKLAKPTGSAALRTREALINAGIQLFSLQGYEATSTRQIETTAGVQRSLMTYHFNSKEEFWKACMRVLNQKMADILAPAISQASDIELGERIRFLTRRFIRASAMVPEVCRIMFDEGRNPSWRLEWLVDEYARGFYAAVSALFDEGREAGLVADIPNINFYYLLVGSAAVFSMSAECERLTGRSSLEPDIVDAHADAIARLIAPTASAG
ncbi:MAG: TetR family transcriptional regulator [Pseudomonadota bacterium]